MPELKLGTKFECYNCGTKFYDLGKSDSICPKCGANQKDAASHEPAASSASRRKRKAEVSKPIDIEEEEPIEDVGDDEMVGPDLGEDELVAATDDDEEEEDIDDED
ncbi:MAG: TIGR02300 family protein [Thermoanaerobaculia bacterium]